MDRKANLNSVWMTIAAVIKYSQFVAGALESPVILAV
jgi:hypothetical protein